MQRNKSKLLLFFCICCLMLTTFNLKAQIIFCPPFTLGQEFIDLGQLKYIPFSLNQNKGVSANVEVVFGSNPPIVKIDWSTFQNELQPITDEAAKEFLLLYIAKKTSGFPLSGCTGANPPTTEFEAHIATIAKCSVTTSCLNRLDYDDAIICDNHNLTSQYQVLNGRAYWRSFQQKYCGVKCCTIVIKVKCENSPMNGQLIPTFTKNTIESPCPPSGLTECNGPFPPPPTPKILPCVGPCEIGD